MKVTLRTFQQWNPRLHLSQINEIIKTERLCECAFDIRGAVNRGFTIYTDPTEAVKFPLESTVKHCWAQTFSCNPPMTLISSVALPFLQLPKPSPRGCSALGLKNGPRRRGLRYFQTLRQILLCVLLNDFL